MKAFAHREGFIFVLLQLGQQLIPHFAQFILFSLKQIASSAVRYFGLKMYELEKCH
jgi:hypothetical protein